MSNGMVDIETVEKFERMGKEKSSVLPSSSTTPRRHGRFHGGNSHLHNKLNDNGERINMNGQRVANKKRHHLLILLLSVGIVIALFSVYNRMRNTYKLQREGINDMDDEYDDDNSWKKCLKKHHQKKKAVASTTTSTTPDFVYRVIELCDIPDLDDDIFNSDVTMDIKVLVDDDIYWPQNIQEDCSSIYGSYDGSCVIPDSALLGICYELSNPIELPLNVDVVGAVVDDEEEDNESGGIVSQVSNNPIKVTVYDEDIFSDDYIDIFVPPHELWEAYYREYGCDDDEEDDGFLHPTLTLEYPAPSKRNNGYIKISIERPPPKVCGYELSKIENGLVQTVEVFQNMTSTLDLYITPNYLNPDDEVDGSAITVSGGDGGTRRRNKQRQLFIGALITGGRVLVQGVTSFAGIFARGAKAQGPLSTLADLTTIGGTLFSNLAPKNDDNSPQQFIDYTNQFDQIFDSLDVIDSKLDGIQTQLQIGFQKLQLTIQEELAQQELDDWITSGSSHLASLQSDYNAYRNPNFISNNQRNVYKNIFRASCQQFHTPISIVQFIYSHTCKKCTLFTSSSSGGSGSGGRTGTGSIKSQQYILDTYVNLAKNLDVTKLPNLTFGGGSNVALTDDEKRILWFRQTFGTIMIAAMTQTIYLHSVCLYDHPDDNGGDGVYCQNEDPVWSSRLDEMGQALEEIATNLISAEERIIILG